MKRKVDLVETTKPKLWHKLSSMGNEIGNVLKWITALGIAVTLIIQVRDAKKVLYEDHQTIISVPTKIESMRREYDVRWKEQGRLDSAQNKQIGNNPELKAFMEAQQHTLDLVLQEIKKNGNNNYYQDGEYPMSMTQLPK
jgi:hypothetical protein